MSSTGKVDKLILIDENMLEEAIMEQVTEKTDEKQIMQQEGINFSEVLQLSLMLRGIPRIENLWEFTSLEKLDLSNNLIEKIVGLDRLLNLTWLNLSYNCLEEIEGLESLQKLEVLNLSSNRISVIKNMDTLKKLTQFSIRNNTIEQLENVLYLRKFKNLYTLNLSGNPASKDENYKLFIAAYFPKLTCLDDKLLDRETKKKAYIKHQTYLEELRLKELQEVMQNQVADQNEFVKFLNECCSSESMLKADPKAETLRCVSEIAEVMDAFEGQMQELFAEITTVSLAEHNQREAEVDSFISAQSAAMKDYKKKVSEIMQQNLQRMMELLKESDSDPQKEKISQPCNSLGEKENHVSQTEIIVELHQIPDPDVQGAKISLCNNEIRKLYDCLVEMECLHVSQMEDIINKLDHNLSEMVSSFGQTVQGLFTQCRDVEDEYHDQVRKVAAATLEKTAKDGFELIMQDDVQMLFRKKDTVTNALDTAHKNHLLKINDRETQLVNRVKEGKEALIKGIQDKELMENRTRMSDCHRYVDHLREQLEELPKYPPSVVLSQNDDQ